MEYTQKFQELLKKLFQFETSDLDFGIYHILNYKRAQIEKFIQEDLVEKVESAFARYKDERLSSIKERFQEAKLELQDTAKKLGKEPLTLAGDLKDEFKDSELGRKYLALRAQKDESETIVEIKLQVFNDLYSFFSRYYEEGDFVPHYRYSIKGHKYAIPYNGEEVKLYWANNEQYYTKTGLLFRDYTFKTGDNKVIFRIVSAKEEAGSQKATKERFFVLDDERPVENVIASPPQADEAISRDKSLIIRFQYRELSGDEIKTYGVEGGSNASKQEKINNKTYEQILGNITDKKLKAVLSQEHKPVPVKAAGNGEGNEKPLLLYQISRFTAKNTKDYFIHKNLNKFLSDQLDYFIKAEVLDLETLEQESASGGLDKHITRAKVVRDIGENIIDFLSQIEDFQKRLWEKKKFVLKTEYVITTDRIPEEFYEEILKNKDQLKEWKELGFTELVIPAPASVGVNLSPPKRGAGIQNLHLPIDTKYFSSEFKEKLLEKITEKADLDDLLDGLLIKSENWQALNLLPRKYKEKIKCIHIDPPYNTQTSGFLYKNDYQHSSWLAMMWNRIKAGIDLMSRDGSYLCHVDENEYEHLHLLFEQLAIPNAGTIAWDKRNPMNAGRGIATQHEYIIWRSGQKTPIYLRNKNILSMLKAVAEIVEKYHGVSEKAQKEYAAWVNNNSELSGGEKAYHYLDEQGHIYRSVSLRAPEPRTDPKFFRPLKHPVTKKPCPVPPNGFSRTPETLRTMIERGEIIFGADETTQPNQKMLLTEESRRQISSVIQDGRKGKADVSPLGLDFPYCHPVSLYEELIGAAVQSSNNRDIVLDYFAGSGTTAHAVMKLNKEDGGKRKYILVDMANYFDTVLIPRLKKVCYSFNWKDGKPQDTKGISQFFKYQTLEQYEDTLDNIGLAPNKQAELKFGGDYLLKYFLDYEVRGNPSLLNIDLLEKPFSYKLKVNLEEAGETQEMVVDIPETFNYLLGLKVKKMKTREIASASSRNDGVRKYLFVLGEKEGKDIAIIWREYNGKWSDDDFKKDKEFIVKELESWAPHIVYVNGQSILAPELWEIRYIEPEFKRLMEGQYEKPR